MHSEVLRCEPGPRPAGIRRRRGRRAEATTAPFWRTRHRRPASWASPEAPPLDPGRSPEESYRDYIFRKAIWP
jgi:hypothetical protein